MKILICGNVDVWAIENHYNRFLNQLGVKTSVFPAGNYFREKYKTTFQKIAYKVYPLYILNSINESLLNTIEEQQPDVIWVFKGMEIYPETLKIIRRKKIFLVNYNPDHPFLFSSRGSGNKYIERSLSLYNLHFSYNSKVIEKIKSSIGLPCELLPFGYDHGNSEYGFIPERERLRIAFIGNPDPIRVNIIKEIKKAGLPIDIYGNRWNKFIREGSDLKIFNSVYGIELWKALQTYRVQLNIFRLHNKDSHNMRTFEIPSVGGVMLSEKSIEQTSFFEENEEAFYYTGITELMAKATDLLTARKEYISEVRENAYIKSIKGKHSYKERSSQFISILQKYI